MNYTNYDNTKKPIANAKVAHVEISWKRQPSVVIFTLEKADQSKSISVIASSQEEVLK